MNRALVVILALALLGCGGSDPTAPGRVGTVSAVASNGRIVITNRTSKPAFTLTVGRERLALIDWVACIDAERCPPIPPGGTRELTYPSDDIGPEEREAVVYWWHRYLDPADADRPDSIRAVIARL